MVLRTRAFMGLVILGWFGLAGGAPLMALVESQQNGVALEGVTFEAIGDGGVLRLRTSGPLGAYRCTLPGPDAKEAVIEVPGAVTRLRSRQDLKNTLIPEAFVDQGADGREVVRVRFALGRGILSGIEHAGDGLLLRIRPAAVAPERTGLAEYRLGKGDKIEITVFGHDDLTKVVEVRADGTINYPLIGDLPVSGRSVAEIDQEITRLLGESFLVDPQVSVDVRDYQSQWITIIGEVRTPGRYVLQRAMRIIDLLATAGGVTREAGSNIVITRSQREGTSGHILVSLEELLGGSRPEANLPLEHGDIVSVGEKEVFYIRGEVQKPGPYFLEKGMTVMKAISVAGGFGQFANRKDVQILRAGDKGVQEKLTVNLKAIEDGKKEDVAIRPNDTVIVPRRIF
jgi:polysaccharide export outer membrane protein